MYCDNCPEDSTKFYGYCYSCFMSRIQQWKEKRKCMWCSKTLVSIGNARSNGACHSDWNSRKTHKKCWKILKYGY